MCERKINYRNIKALTCMTDMLSLGICLQRDWGCHQGDFAIPSVRLGMSSGRFCYSFSEIGDAIREILLFLQWDWGCHQEDFPRRFITRRIHIFFTYFWLSKHINGWPKIKSKFGSLPDDLWNLTCLGYDGMFNF